jgi:hypothetical protein
MQTARPQSIDLARPELNALSPKLWCLPKHFVIDGEAVTLGVDSTLNLNALHSRNHDHEVQLYALTAWRSMAKTCASCRSRCARPP